MCGELGAHGVYSGATDDLQHCGERYLANFMVVLAESTTPWERERNSRKKVAGGLGEVFLVCGAVGVNAGGMTWICAQAHVAAYASTSLTTRARAFD